MAEEIETFFKEIITKKLIKNNTSYSKNDLRNFSETNIFYKENYINRKCKVIRMMKEEKHTDGFVKTTKSAMFLPKRRSIRLSSNSERISRARAQE